MAQIGQLFAVERLCRVLLRKAGQQLVYDFGIARALKGRGHDKRCGIRLLEQIFQLEHLVVCIYSDEHAADFRRGKQGEHPLRDVRRPDGDMVALFQAHGQKTLGDFVRLLIKFTVGAGIVAIGVAVGQPVAVQPHPLLQQFGQGHFE